MCVCGCVDVCVCCCCCFQAACALLVLFLTPLEIAFRPADPELDINGDRWEGLNWFLVGAAHGVCACCVVGFCATVATRGGTLRAPCAHCCCCCWLLLLAFMCFLFAVGRLQTIMFAVDILVTFRTAYMDDGELVKEPKAIAANYVKVGGGV